MANIVVISGQFGDSTSFADSPVIIKVSGLSWPTSKPSPFTIVRVEIRDQSGSLAGDFRADTGQQTEIEFDISSALKAIWSDYDFSAEVRVAGGTTSHTRPYRSYSITVFTEYLNTDGYFEVTESGTLNGGHCAIGGLTEWERSLISNADMSILEGQNRRNGDASTKPTVPLERVGRDSITSWVDLSSGGTSSYFYSHSDGVQDSDTPHAPLVLRDNIPYVDFLFLNRRGAIETCSAQMLENLAVDVSIQQYARVVRPSFSPSRTLMAIGSDGRRSWQMSSGYQTREWAAWWAMEFLGGRRKQWWMKYKGPGMSAEAFVPVIVKPSKSSINIYDRTKQNLPHVDFDVTLALEG